MANKEDLARVRLGAVIWNTWRIENQRSPVDLGGAHLESANLSWMDLREVNLGGANLRGANLEGANLEGANLCEAGLWWAHFREPY